MSHLLIILSIVASSFSKSDFFNVLSNGTQTEIESFEKKVIAYKQDIIQQAYLGTIKMKLSEFGKTPSDKLKEFKSGKALLENSIKAEPSNVEFRFLRLIIQENAPKMLKYNSNISEDAATVKSNVERLPSDVKKAAIQYASKSQNLNL